MASNVEATKKGYEFFRREGIPPLIRDLLDDNCIWISPGPGDKLPWAGTFKGKYEIANFFAQMRWSWRLFSRHGPAKNTG
jgi:uncharacterized protein